MKNSLKILRRFEKAEESVKEKVDLLILSSLRSKREKNEENKKRKKNQCKGKNI